VPRKFPPFPLEEREGILTKRLEGRDGFQKAILFLSIFLFIQSSLLSQARIESEFKLKVSPEIQTELWDFLNEKYNTSNLQKIDTALTCITGRERFIDVYFDNEDAVLFENNAGARYRRRFLQDSLLKQLFQLKLPREDSTGVARTEMKFSVYEKIKKSDRKAMHPFWKHIRPKDREEVDLQLAEFFIKGDDLSQAIKVEQDRRRIYIHENGEALMTITLDEVSNFYFPYPKFTELELELNEIRYTDGDYGEQKRLEAFNENLKSEIMTRFPSLQQDQTPKYNKMRKLVGKNPVSFIYSNLMYFILGGIVMYAGLVFVRFK